MNTKTSKPFATAIVAIGMLSFSFANQAFAAISAPPADKALVNAIIVVAPGSAVFGKDDVSGKKAPLIRVAPHGCSSGCMNHEDHG